MTRIAATSLLAASLVACSDATEPAAQAPSQAELVLIDAIVDGSLLSAALQSAERFPEGRPRLDAFDQGTCRDGIIRYERARPAPHVELSGTIELRPASCDQVQLDRDELLIMRLDLEIEAGEASAWMGGELSCRTDREGQLWCTAADGAIATLDSSRFVELDLADATRAQPMQIDDHACFEIANGDGNTSEICLTY